MAPLDGPDDVVGRAGAVGPEVADEPGAAMPSGPVAPGSVVVAPGDVGAPVGDEPPGASEAVVVVGSATWSCHTT
jgi:hypothetical protein